MRKQNNLYKTPIWNNVFEHLNYIFPAVLYDKFGFNVEQIAEFQNESIAMQNAWKDKNDSDITTETLLRYCTSNGIDIIGFIKDIPMSKKLYIASNENNKQTKLPVDAPQKAESVFILYLLFTVPGLIMSYSFEKESILSLFGFILDYIDSYQKKYVTNETIRQMFIEDENWDIVIGQPVSNKH